MEWGVGRYGVMRLRRATAFSLIASLKRGRPGGQLAAQLPSILE